MMQSRCLVVPVRYQRMARLDSILFCRGTNRCSAQSTDLLCSLRECRRTLSTNAVEKMEPSNVYCSMLRPENWNQLSATRVASIMAAFGVVFSLGYQTGRSSSDRGESKTLVLPNGLPRTCCDHDANDKSHHSHQNLTPLQSQLPKKLQRIVGKENVLDGMVYNTRTTPFLKGARLGMGQALCIVTPRHLHHVMSLVEACVEADCIVLPQGQNTGLTGGSVPHQNDSSRPVVLISFKHLDSIFPIDDGERVVCMAGVGLASLEQFIKKNFPDRESHSILGSTFLNPTTAAGVAFGSGGTQCRKGPAYTERALYLKITTNKWQEKVVEVVNTLGIEGFEDIDLPPNQARKQMDTVAYRVDTWGRWIKEGYEHAMKYSSPAISDATEQRTYHSSDVGYAAKLCRRNSSSVSRFNADTSGPDLCRSEGKVIILATVHDTFPKPKATKTFWFSFDTLDTALQFRRLVALDNPADLPVSMEYMDRDAFDVVDEAGRALGTTIKLVGTSSPLVRRLWNVKLWIEALPYTGAPLWIDTLLFRINRIFPALLPRAIMEMGRSRDHHVVMTIGDFDDGNMGRILHRINKFSAEMGKEKVTFRECASPREVAALSAFRFVAAPAFRTWCVGKGVQGYSVDYALPKNGGVTPHLVSGNAAVSDSNTPVKRMRYSHFACNVVHEDLAYGPEVDIEEAKHTFKKVIEYECGGKLPAEHGHGTEYVAPPETQKRWKNMDPLNILNPGVGGLSSKFKYEE